MPNLCHDRTEIGRSLLRLREGVCAWVAGNTGRATPDVILAAETLCCELYSAAHNGLAIERAALLESIDRMESHQSRTAPSGRRG